MSRIAKIHNSVCEHCDEGKTKAETTQGIVACTTCGAEDPNFLPLISESDLFRDAYKRRGGIESIYSFEDMQHARHREEPNEVRLAKHRASTQGCQRKKKSFSVSDAKTPPATRHSTMTPTTTRTLATARFASRFATLAEDTQNKKLISTTRWADGTRKSTKKKNEERSWRSRQSW